MIVYRGLTELPPDFAAGAVAIGNFDGVHRGHARIIDRLTERAAQFSGPAVVFTFEPHPVRLLRPAAAPPPLTWLDRKVQLLSSVGVDIVVAYPTDKALLALTPEAYYQEIICHRLKAKAIVEGPNFFFGKDRAGNVDTLAELCRQHGQNLDIVEPLRLEDDYISSSRVRAAIAMGDVRQANAMLTQPYRVRGMVTHGAGRGATIGFPTANVSAIDTLLPGAGVYAGRGYANGQHWPAAINIGPSPTFREGEFKVEAHLIGFEGDLYGAAMEIDLIDRLRDICTFESPEQLVAQLRKDVERAGEVVRSIV